MKNTFYLMKKNGSAVEEIRRIVTLSGKIHYLIDRKGGNVNFVSKEEFVNIPKNYRLVRI